MIEKYFFEDLQIGDSWKSPARTVTETDVVNFAGITGDFDPLHVDYEFARNSPYHRPIAHGLLGLAWAAGLASQCPRVSTVAFVAVHQWEFRRPIYIGDTIHVVSTVVEKRPNGRRSGFVLWTRELINQEGSTVQSGKFETLVATRLVSANRSSTVRPQPVS
jgi:3-hydroxybutyryl-CoA dehydratase